MDFNIHDSAGVLVGIVEEPTSAIWARRYQNPGDFEIYTPASPDLLAVMQEGNYITRPDRPEIMLIEYVQITTSDEEGDYIIAKGRGAECLLDRRVIYPQTQLSGRVDKGIYRLIVEHAISPENADRALPILMQEPDVIEDTFEAQYTGAGLLETVQEICAAYGLGFCAVTDDHSQTNIRFVLMKGEDRSEDQSVNPRVVFSPEFENLISSEYVYDTTAFKNCAIVAGEGEGTDRKIAVYGGGVGVARREAFVDARDMSTEDGNVSDAEYQAQLEARGAENLAETQLVDTFNGEVETNNTYTLDVDYTIGDIVTVENEYGIRKNTRIMAVMESWDESGYIAELTFEGQE